MGKLRLAVIAVVTVLIGILIFQNMESVETKLLFVTVAMPRAFLLGITALGGFIAGLLVAARVR